MYQSMQRVRFKSPDDYIKFMTLFANTRHHLMDLPGFMHLTWWVHPDDTTWFNEVSFWTSYDSLKDWHLNTYHKYAKDWAVRSGAITEVFITNFEFVNARLIRVCPCCAKITDQAYQLNEEQAALAKPCGTCGFRFPIMPNTNNSTALFKDVVLPSHDITPDLELNDAAGSAIPDVPSIERA